MMSTAEQLISVELRGISKQFLGIPVVKQVDFQVPAGSITGLVGENGAGKSTLMNMLGGVLAPDAGSMMLNGQQYAPRSPADAAAAGVAFIHQELNVFPNLSVAENLHIGALPRRRSGDVRLPVVDWGLVDAQAQQLLRRVGLSTPARTPLDNLSPGQRQLVEIAKALGARAKLLILDEPTTSLTRPEADRLFHLLRELRDQGVTVIYISHNLADVLALCDRMIVLRDGALVSSGPAETYDEPQLIREMVGRSVDQVYPSRSARPSGEVLLEVDHLASSPLVRDVSLKLHRGEILGLAGLMGAGRTEVARALFGLQSISGGSIRLDGKPFKPSPRLCVRSGMAFLTEDRRHQGLMLDASILDNVALAALPHYTRAPAWFIRRKKLESSANETTQQVRLRASAGRRQSARTLSGGNQQKVVLARWLLNGPRLLFLDEPTRGVDVGAKLEIYQLIHALADQGKSVLLISSEIEELVGLCDRILVLSSGISRDTIDRADFDRERILRAALAGSSSVLTHQNETA